MTGCRAEVGYDEEVEIEVDEEMCERLTKVKIGVAVYGGRMAEEVGEDVV